MDLFDLMLSTCIENRIGMIERARKRGQMGRGQQIGCMSKKARPTGTTTWPRVRKRANESRRRNRSA